MDDLIEFELEMLGAGPRSGCLVLQADSGLTTLRLLSPWLAGEPVPGRSTAGNNALEVLRATIVRPARWS